ncbi:helix-turn-helix domain-containing protein [Lentzea sp. NEAU-D7]|uniref:helix-turn-helix domain-containing protein n=1 Tax=Lentzea sp. NEAU-D7 TaxID=2994667 RepID=UPI00224B277A|nr:helix-turn-helix transcriptional regulator [Lentzea sp. NEAU-D7]MCX2948996.1 helix-turn-helix transcriptional regulator [Lentzea sp. NEAU-D7]
MPQRCSTARGREFGEGVRAAIKASGMPARRVAELVGWQEAKLSDFLNGKIGCTETELALLLGVCRTPVEERDHLLRLRPATHVKGWWQKHGSCSSARLRTLVENVREAKTLTTWHPHGLPAFLQSADYLRATMLASPNVPDEEADRRVAAGRELQEVLSGGGLQCTFYIHEQALHLPVGGDEVHVGQMHHLLLMAVRRNVTIRILPTAVGAHAGMSGAFTRLTFCAHEPLVVVELENSTLIEEDKDSVEGYLQVVRSLDRAGLDEERSKMVLLQLAERLSTADSSGHDRLSPGALAVGAPFPGGHRI